MCKPHWNAYTAGLARDAKAMKAAAQGPSADEAGAAGAEVAGEADASAPAPDPGPKRTRRRSSPAPEAA
jgi:hypothetical protein